MRVQADSFYNRFASLYPLVDIFLKPQKNALMREIDDLPHGDLLEIGVGNGAHLHQYTKHTVTAIDSSLAMLEVARKKHVANVKLMQMDGQALDFDDAQFDYVVLSHVIAVVANPEKLINEVFRVLKPSGKVFYSESLYATHLAPPYRFSFRGCIAAPAFQICFSYG